MRFAPVIDILTSNDFREKIFLRKLVVIVSANYMLSMLSIDRVIAVWFPIFYFQNSKPKYALMTSLAIVLISSVVTLPSISLYGVQNGMCHIVHFDWLTPEQADLFLLVAGFGLLLLIPLLGILVANMLIIWKLRTRTSSRTNVVPSYTQYNPHPTSSHPGCLNIFREHYVLFCFVLFTPGPRFHP